MKVVIAAILLMSSISLAQSDRHEYTANVNLLIPQDSIGIRDTIFIPDHLLIEDINFYVGVGHSGEPWAEHVLVDVFSPSRSRVRLNDWGGVRIYLYNIWYDTEREEDGPGQLEDYAGGDAYGPWEMFCFDPFEGNLLTWYNWRIEVISNSLSIGGESDPAIPKDYAINDIYPNPFNSQMVINYAVPVESPIRLEVFDIGGRMVKTLLDERSSVGYHRIVWDGANDMGKKVSSGVYLIRLISNERRLVARATLLK
jgi:hypothetical protein